MAVIILNRKPKPSHKKQIKADPIKDPKKIEYDARRTLKAISAPVKKDIMTLIESMREKNLDAATTGRSLDNIKRRYEAQFDMIAPVISERWVGSINKYNREETMETLRRALGIDVGTIISEDMKEDLDIMMYEAAMYIKTIPSELVLKVADRVLQHYKGIPMPENRTLARQIKEEFKISDNKSKVIARDQTAKMNCSLAALRQKEVGIDKYIWETSGDRRVVGTPGGLYTKINDKHKNHYAMSGLVCRWDDPTVYSDDKGKTWKKRTAEMPHNHPGDDIQCRCRAAPYIDISELKVKWAV